MNHSRRRIGIGVIPLVMLGLNVVEDVVQADNNLVTTLLDISEAQEPPYRFTNPRDGWIFIAVGDDESMRWMKAGPYPIKGDAGKPLIVRAIPEIIHGGLGYHPSPFMKSFPTYDVAYLEKIGLLKNVNVVLERSPDPDFDIAEWKASGRQIRVRAGSGEAQPQDMVEYWAHHRGMQNPYDGIMISEYDGWKASKHRPHYHYLSDAVRKISEDPQFEGKKLIPYTVAMYDSPEPIEFLKTLFRYGHLQACERYISEQPSLKAAKEELHWMNWIMAEYRKVLPGSVGNSILTLGFMSAPPETLDICTNANYLTFMDMQMRAIATEPAYQGLYGVMWYHTAYADEEVLRWSAKLIRHYCIEGKSSPLSKDPYILPHLRNGDFIHGVEEWKLDQAQPGSMSVRKHEGLSYLQTRYPQVEQGKHFLWTKRHANKPNVFTQIIKNLEPGRAYALKMMVCDYGDLMQWRDNEQIHKPIIQIEDGEMMPEASFRESFRSGWAGHGYEKFNRQNNLWFTYHRLVFRAKSKTARLSISDWESETNRGGPVDQELAFNYISVQPYLED